MSTTERTGAALHDIPGDPGLPVVGYTVQFATGRMTTDRSRYDKYGPVSWLRAFGRTWVSAQGPDACGEVLHNRDHAFDSGPGWSSSSARSSTGV